MKKEWLNPIYRFPPSPPSTLPRRLTKMRGLSGAIPESIGRLSKLQILYDTLYNLRILFWKRCYWWIFKNIAETSWIFFPKTVISSLWRHVVITGLTGPIPAGIGSLSDLRSLYVTQECLILDRRGMCCENDAALNFRFYSIGNSALFIFTAPEWLGAIQEWAAQFLTTLVVSPSSEPCASLFQLSKEMALISSILNFILIS